MWKPHRQEDKLVACFKQGRKLEDIVELGNKRPAWDAVAGGHVLNFKGRVTESSVKNFQLICPKISGQEEVVLQFGRVSKTDFTMDFRYPLSPIQAFGIVLASLDPKVQFAL